LKRTRAVVEGDTVHDQGRTTTNPDEAADNGSSARQFVLGAGCAIAAVAILGWLLGDDEAWCYDHAVGG
jgi:hypothetical protein